MKSIKGKVYDLIVDASDGLVAGEIYELLPDVSQRTIRYGLNELLNAELIKKDRSCRCHSAPIYELNCKKCNSSRFCKEHHHTTSECLAGCECLKD